MFASYFLPIDKTGLLNLTNKNFDFDFSTQKPAAFRIDDVKSVDENDSASYSNSKVRLRRTEISIISVSFGCHSLVHLLITLRFHTTCPRSIKA